MERIWLTDVEDGLGLTWVDEKGGVNPIEYRLASSVEKEIAELKKQRDEIVKYARHGLKCMYGFQGDKWKCTCGLEKLLPEPPKENNDGPR